MASQAKTVFSTNIFFWLRVHMVNVHICRKNHKNRVHQKKTFVLSNYLKKTYVSFSENTAWLWDMIFCTKVRINIFLNMTEPKFWILSHKKSFLLSDYLKKLKFDIFVCPLKQKRSLLQTFPFSWGYIWSMCIYVGKIIKIGCTKKKLLFLVTT